MASIAGQVAIVTGASTGIGAAVALALAREGAKVCLAARSTAKLVSLQEEVSAAGGVAIAVTTDVTDRGSCRDMVEKAEKELGRVDILVNNAGVSWWEYMKNVNQDAWDEMIDVNIRGTLNCIAAVLPGMVARQSGHIVNMSSVRGVAAGPAGAVYSGTKFFVEGMSSGLRQEVQGAGVRVSTIQPGLVDTPLVTRNLEEPKDTEAQRDRVERMEGLQMLRPEDVAGAVVFVVTQPKNCNINSLPVMAVSQVFG